MSDLLALVLAGTLAAISLLHFSWAAGLTWPGSDPGALSDKVLGAAPGAPMPPAWLTTLVACAIMSGAGVILLFSLEIWLGPWRPRVATAYLLLTLVFLLRGLAGYVPAIWRRTRETSFYRLNRAYYSPLCLLIAVGLAINFILG